MYIKIRMCTHSNPNGKAVFPAWATSFWLAASLLLSAGPLSSVYWQLPLLSRYFLPLQHLASFKFAATIAVFLSLKTQKNWACLAHLFPLESRPLQVGWRPVWPHAFSHVPRGYSWKEKSNLFKVTETGLLTLSSMLLAQEYKLTTSWLLLFISFCHVPYLTHHQVLIFLLPCLTLAIIKALQHLLPSHFLSDHSLPCHASVTASTSYFLLLLLG